MSEDEIKQKIKEAEEFAETDKKKKEEIETRNQAETLIYETEKNLKQLEGKLSEEEASKITAAKEDLAKVLENGTLEEIKAKIEALTNEFHIMSTKLYEQAQAAAGGTDPGQGDFGQAQQAPDDNVVDADFEVVDDEKKDE